MAGGKELKMKIYIVDSFTEKRFCGNQAGVVLLESGEDFPEPRKDATPMVKNPQGKRLPKIEGETDYVKLRSLKIYRATVREDQEKLWNNPQIQAQFKGKLGLIVVQPTDVIDAVLKAGQKAQICDIIDELSGFDSDDEIRAEDYAKN